jgi:ATP-dependent Clp protease protease subunit
MDYDWGYSKKRKCVSSVETVDDKPKKQEINDEFFIKKLKKYINGTTASTKITMNHNRIYFYSDVNRDSIHTLIDCINKTKDKCLTMAKDYSINPPPIYLHIHSYGGSVFSALAAIDTIRNCEVPIYSIVEGCAASAATMMSVVASKRFITKNSKMLVHQLSSGMWGQMDDLEEEMENLQTLMTTIKQLYKDHAKISDDKLDEILKHDVWWNADKCLSYGLVDKIL